jgi:hypothetical protein
VQQAILGIDEGTDKLFNANPSVLYEQYAASVGKSAGALNDSEKALALLNAALRDGGRVAGAYGEFLDTAAGRAAALDEQVRKTEEAVGQLLEPFRALGGEVAGDVLAFIGENGPLVIGAGAAARRSPRSPRHHVAGAPRARGAGRHARRRRGPRALGAGRRHRGARGRLGGGAPRRGRAREADRRRGRPGAPARRRVRARGQVLASSTASAKEKRTAEERLKQLKADLTALGPQYAAALEQEANGYRAVAAAVRGVSEEKARALEFEELGAALEVDELRRALAGAEQSLRSLEGAAPARASAWAARSRRRARKCAG